MEGQPSSSRKRPSLFDDEDDPNKSKQKRVRFPKGKKVKPPTEPVVPIKDQNEEEPCPQDFSDPRLAAKERARRRSQMTTQLFTEDRDIDVADISAVEVHYQENGTFVDDGIQFEPFNLEREREEGFFDEAGNYVEYVFEKEEKDAWLDSIEFDPKLAEWVSTMEQNGDEEQEQELSSADIAKIKRRIADVLEPGETVLQALKRLKGHTNDKKAKMSAETKAIFEQLTEDAMRLMDNGDYNVYHEEREVFQREAEGYEALVQARNNDLSANEGDSFDMFADENDVADNPEQNNQTSVPSESTGTQLSGGVDAGDSGSSWIGQNDYVYDEATGYYYSSILGYYYDPATGLFCSATSGQWYKYNEDTGVYDEVEREHEHEREAEAGSENNEGTTGNYDQLQNGPEEISNVS